jgi:hypothetical protein
MSLRDRLENYESASELKEALADANTYLRERHGLEPTECPLKARDNHQGLNSMIATGIFQSDGVKDLREGPALFYIKIDVLAALDLTDSTD